MTIEERDSLKIGDTIIIKSRPSKWQGVMYTERTRGVNIVEYPYTCIIKDISLTQEYPGFNCQNNYGWSLSVTSLKHYEIKKYTPKVGDWVTITKGDRWSCEMDKFIGRTVQITKVVGSNLIKFKDSDIWNWNYKWGHFRPMTQDEIDSVTSTELPNCFYVDVSKGTPEQLEVFATWYYEKIRKHKGINYIGLKEQEWVYYGFENYEEKDCDRHDNIDYIKDNDTLYTIEDFIDIFLNPKSVKYINTIDNIEKTTSKYIPKEAFKETESKQKIIFNHKLILPTIKIVRRNQKIKF